MNDNVLRCNNLKCRRPLQDRAAVTVCRHLICIECVQDPDLGGQGKEQLRRSCPACNAEFTHQDDVSFKDLNPNERLKSELLIGLTPASIIECALRAMQFWGEQWTHEACLQDYQCRRLKEKLSKVQVTLETTWANARATCQTLEDKIEESRAETRKVRQKFDDLARAYQIKSQELLRVEERNAQIRQASTRGQLKEAADEAVDESMRQIGTRRPSKDDERDFHIQASDFLPPVPPFGTRDRGDAQQPDRALNRPALQREPLQKEDPFGWPRREPLGRPDFPSQPTNGRRSRPALASPAERVSSSRVLGRQAQSKGSIRLAQSPRIPTRHRNFPGQIESPPRHLQG